MSTVGSFGAMGCDVVVGGASAAELRDIEELFERREQTFSRFRGGSEIERINRSAAPALDVSRDFAEAMRAALAAAELTGGLVDPTLHDALVGAGYDADLSALPAREHAPLGPPVRGRLQEVRVSGTLLLRPPDLRLDLNGVVKSMAVDAALELIAGEGFVSAGGDLATRGPLDVALPAAGSIRLVRGALATSGSSRRAWDRGGERCHHLIDPATGRPSDSPWSEVTVCATTCLGADVAAKAAFLLGAAGPAWLDARAMPGRFVGTDGEIQANDRWRAAVPEAAPCT